MPQAESPSPDLARIEARLDRLEEKLSRLTDLLDQATPALAIGIDVLDEEVRKAQDRGVDVDLRLRRAGELLEKLTDPTVLDGIEKLVAHAPLAAEGAELAATAPAYTAIAIDVLDEEIRKLQAEGLDVDKALNNGATLVRALGRFLAIAEGQQFLDSGLLEPDTLHRITQLSSAVVTTLNEEPPLIGPWGSFVRTWDRRFQRFAGFSFALAWRVGALLGPNGKSLPAPRS